MGAPPLTAAELLSEVVWLLEVDYAGKTYRWATEPVAVANDAGVALLYHGGLDVDLDLGFDLFSDAADPVSVSFELLFPDNVAELVASGHDLSAGRGELSLWVDGRTYEDRQVMLAGTLEFPSYGAEDEPIRFSLREDSTQDRAQIPEAAARITLDTWPDHDPAATGRYYPVVFGAPGIYTEVDGSAGQTTGSPAFIVEIANDRALICDGHAPAATVRAINLTTGVAGNKTPILSTDGLGRPVTKINTSGFAVEGDEIWIRWDSGGGLIGYSEPGASLTGAGELCRWLLDRSTLRIDSGRWAAAQPFLDRYRVAGFFDDAASPWDLLADHLLPILPISLATGPEGIYPIVWDPSATTSSAVLTVTAGPEFQRVSDVEYEGGELANAIRVDFAPRGDAAGEYRRSVFVCGEPAVRNPGILLDPPVDPAYASNQFSSLHAKVSELRYGRIEAEPIQTDIVYDQDTATLIALDQIRRRAFRRRVVTYAATWRYASLMRGAVVSLTDADVALSGAVALVQNVLYAEDGIEVTLALVEDPVRDVR